MNIFKRKTNQKDRNVLANSLRVAVKSLQAEGETARSDIDNMERVLKTYFPLQAENFAFLADLERREGRS